MTDIQLRLKDFRLKLGFTQEQFAKIFGVDRTTYSKIEKGKYEPPLKYVEILHNEYNLNPEWLISGNGDCVINRTGLSPVIAEYPESNYTIENLSNDKLILKNLSLTATKIIEIEAVAGLPVPVEISEIETGVKLLPGLSFRVQMMIRVRGDSMEPEILNGDTLLITPVLPNEITQDKMYVVHTLDGRTFLKIVSVDLKRRIYMLRSLNPNYGPEAFEEGEIHAFYKVLAKIAKTYE